MPETTNISDSEDTDSTYILKIKQRSEWLKLIPDDKTPATLEPTWVIPSSHILDAVNNWANALAITYQAPTENFLLENIWDMRTFMHWYCQQIGKTELTKQTLKAKHMKSLKLSTETSFIFSSRWKSVTNCLQIRLTGLTQKVINKGSGQALSISMMKAACYLDFGLELLVPEHMWINEDICLRQDESRRDYGWLDNADSVVVSGITCWNCTNAPPTLKDPKIWTAKEKKTRKIDRLARSLLIQGLSNDIYSLIDSNDTAKDLWDAFKRHMHGSEYGEQDRKAAILYPLALVAEKTTVSKCEEKVEVQTESEGSDDEDIRDLKRLPRC
nr:hypothetical protein [Tanacetum cinerariifolium]